MNTSKTANEIVADSTERPSFPALANAATENFRARVVVMASKFAKGAETIDEVKNAPKMRVLLLADALKTKCSTDGHLGLYASPKSDRIVRLRKAMANVLGHDQIEIGSLFFDIDNTDENGAKKELKTREEREAFLKKVTDAAAQIGGEPAKWRAAYTTKNGARLVFELTAPVSPNEAEEIMLGIIGVFKKAGIQMDEACKDWTRLFRLPYVVRDDKDTSEHTILIYHDDTPSADPALLPRVSKGHQSAQRKAAKNGTSAAPTAQNDNDGPGEAIMQDILAALHDSELRNVISEGAEIAPVNGPGRHTAIVKYAGMAVQKWIEVPGMTAGQICDLLRPHVQKLAPDTDADPLAWEKLMEKMVHEFWARDMGAGKKPVSAKKASADAASAATRGDEVVLYGKAPKALAEAFLREHRDWHLANWRGTFYWYKDGFYLECPDAELKALIRLFLEKCAVRTKTGLAPLTVTIGMVAEAMAAMQARIMLPDSQDMPFWRDGRAGPKAGAMVVLRDAIFDIETGLAMPSDPALFALGGCDYGYVKDTAPPVKFLAFLAPWFADDPSGKGIRVIQQFAGLMLASTLGFQKALYIVGAPGNGKGVLFSVLRWLVGMDASASPTIGSLSKDEGLEELVGRKAGFVADATFDSNLDRQSALTANLLNIIAGDHTQFNRKYKRHWQGRLATRLAFASNMPPKFHDASGAMARRLVIIQLNDSKPKEATGNYEETFRAELPAIFNWAVQGYRDLVAKGRFEEPESSGGLRGTMEATTAPIKQFLQDMCDLGPGYQVPIHVLFRAWKDWCEEGGQKHSGVGWFGRTLHEATRINKAGRHPNCYYPGIRLKPPAAPSTPQPTRGFSPDLMKVSFDAAVAAAEPPKPAPMPAAMPVAPVDLNEIELGLEAIAAMIMNED